MHQLLEFLLLLLDGLAVVELELLALQDLSPSLQKLLHALVIVAQVLQEERVEPSADIFHVLLFHILEGLLVLLCLLPDATSNVTKHFPHIRLRIAQYAFNGTATLGCLGCLGKECFHLLLEYAFVVFH